MRKIYFSRLSEEGPTAQLRVVNDKGQVLSLAGGAVPTGMDPETYFHRIDEATWVEGQFDLTFREGKSISDPVYLLHRLAAHLGYKVVKDQAPIESWEPFGQRFVGLLETNELDQRILHQSESGLTIEQHRSSMLIKLDGPHGPVWKNTSLPVECVYVLYRKLREVLFGTPEREIVPKIKQE